MTLPDLLIIVLATLYVAHSVTETHGPFDVFAKLRGMRWHGGLLNCTVCASLWAALACYLLLYHTPLAPVVYILAIAGGAVVLMAYAGVKHL